MDTDGQVSSATVSITVGVATDVGVAVYEPFDCPVGLLDGASGSSEVGFANPWSATSGITVGAGNLGFSSLVTNGASMTDLQNVNSYGGKRDISADALANAGLLDDGATLWMSASMGLGSNAYTNALAFALSNNQFNTVAKNYAILDDGAELGRGVGIMFYQWRPRAALFRDISTGSNKAPIIYGTQEANNVKLGNNQHQFLVMKITWGATEDTLELYQVQSDMSLGDPCSVLTIDVDQSQFDTLTFTRQNNVEMDEIRLGATYQSVIQGTVPMTSDTEAPTPDPIGVDVAAYMSGPDSISMVAATAFDPLGVEYYFTCISGGGNDSGWQDSSSYTDTGLTPGVTYSYTVKARDKSLAANETGISAATSATIPLQTTVPLVVGVPQAAAEQAIVDAYLSVGAIASESNASFPIPGTVISATPDAGSAAAYGSIVDLMISLGFPSISPADFVDDRGGATIFANNLISYTLTFTLDMDAVTVDVSDFSNAGTAPITIGAITETSPGIFTLEVTPTSEGTLQLQVSAGAILADTNGNLVDTSNAIADDTTITILPPNNPPYWNSNPINAADANEDFAYSGTLATSVTDNDGDTLTFTKIAGPAWLNVATDGTLSGLPLNTDIGANVFTINVSDSNFPAVEATMNITVVAVNDAPVFAVDPIVGADATAGVPYGETLAGAATDEEGDTITYSKDSGPAWLAIDPTGVLTGSPSVSDVGVNAFTVQADDGNGGTTTASLTITVSAAPSYVEGYDFHVDASQDADGDSRWEDLTVGNPTGLELLLDSSPAVNRVVAASPGTLLTHAYDFPGGSVNNEAGALLVPTGGTAMRSFQEASDANWSSQPVTLEIWFKPENLTPAAANGQILFEDGGGTGIGVFIKNNELLVSHDSGQAQISYNLSIDSSGLLLGPATTEFIQAIVTHGTGGTNQTVLYVNGQQVRTSMDDSDWSGGDAAGFGTRGDSNVGDYGSGQASTESFDGQIAMIRAYRAQVLTPTDVIVNFNGLTGEDTTPPALTGSDIVDDQSGGPVSVNSMVTYTVTFGEDIEETTVDATDFSNAGTSAITMGAITEVNPGVFTIEVTPTTESATLQLQVNAGAVITDVAGNALDTTTTIADDTILTIDVPNTPPSFILDPFSTANATEGVAYSGSISGSATDPDAGATLTYALASAQSWLFVASDGSLSGTPGSGDAGSNNFTVSVSDGIALPVTATLNIYVDASLDTTAPNPDPMTWAVAPAPVGAAGIPAVLASTDFMGRTVLGATASNITWTTDGVADPGDLTTDSPDGLFDTANAQGHFAPNRNVSNEGPWSVDVPIVLTGSSITLTDVIFGNQSFNNSGSSQSGKVDFTISVIGSTSGELGSVVINTTSNSASNQATFSPNLTLTSGETYTLRITAVGPGSGNNAGLSSLTINGELPGAGSEAEITMTATTAADPSGVEYYFTETSGNPGGSDSGWQDSPIYTNIGLQAGTTYTYTVMARDKSVNQNSTAASTAGSATTGGTAPSNSVPTWSGNPVMEVNASEDNAYTATLTDDASDADDDPLTFAKVSGPAWLSVAANGDLTGTPANADVGNNAFTVSVNDGFNPAVEATLNITVINTNDALVFTTDSIAGTDATEDSAYCSVIFLIPPYMVFG